jgi:hypothetical protein
MKTLLLKALYGKISFELFDLSVLQVIWAMSGLQKMGDTAKSAHQHIPLLSEMM